MYDFLYRKITTIADTNIINHNNIMTKTERSDKLMKKSNYEIVVLNNNYVDVEKLSFLTPIRADRYRFNDII